MTRPILIVGFGLVHLLTSAWIIRGQGRAYREALASTAGRPGASGAVRVAKAGDADLAHAAAPSKAQRPVSSLPVPPLTSTVEAAPKAVSPATKPAELSPRPAAMVPGPLAATPTPARPSTLESRPATPPAATSPPPLLIAGPVIANILHLSRDEENALGEQLHELIVSRHKPTDKGPWLRRANVAARPILAVKPRIERSYHITVLDSDEVNAFSHPGGYLYLSQGLFDLAAGEEQLQFLLAHEMAHVELKHAESRVAAAQSAASPATATPEVGTLQRIYHQIAGGYSEEQEFEADAWAARRLTAMGLTRRECLAFLQKFDGYSKNHGFENGRKPPSTPLGAPVQDVDNHFRSHPAAWARLDRLKALLAGPR